MHFVVCKIYIKTKIQPKIWHINATEYDSTGMNYGGIIFTKITQNNAIYFLWIHIFLSLWKWKLLSHVWLFLTPMDYKVHAILQARILEWVAFSFSRGSSRPRDQTQVSCSAGGFFTNWAIKEALFPLSLYMYLLCICTCNLFFLKGYKVYIVIF